jgi:hypothetical protein
VRDEALTLEFDVEPKVLVAAPGGEPGWWSLDLTSTVNYALTPWLDAIGELLTGHTSQTDDVSSTEVTPRAGVRFHVFSRDEPRLLHVHERPPTRRVVIRDRMLVEARTLVYGGAASGTDSTIRFRNRLEFQVPLNTAKMTDDRTRYVLADWEWFIPLDDPTERFANRQRIRAGVGYRPVSQWRFEALYIWSRSRDTTDEGFRTSDNIVDLRVKRVF